MKRWIQAAWLWACLAGSVVSASPGVARLPLTSTQDLDRLQAAGPVTLWVADGWALVVPNALPETETVLEPSLAADSFLVVTRHTRDDVRIERMGGIRVAPGVYVLDCPESAVRALPEDHHLVHLGAPYTFRTRSEPPDLPADRARDEQIQAMADAVAPDVLMADLQNLVNFQTRYSYSQGCRDAADWLEAQFESLGCSVERQHHTNGMAPNIIADLEGVTEPDRIVIICGHFDSTSLQPETLAPGADDNGTGSAAVLQAARILSRYHFERTIRFICFSGEEQGLYGSQAYAAYADDEALDVEAVYNFDMIGYVDTPPENLECVGNAASAAIVDHFIQSAQLYTDLLVNRRIDGSIQQSDHAPFWSRGFPAFLGIEDSPLNYPHYHKITDTADKISSGFFTQTTRAAVAAVAGLSVPIPRSIYVFDARPDDSGDDDGYLDPNESVGLIVSIRNHLETPSQSATLTLDCISGCSGITITDAEAFIPELLPGEDFTTDPSAFRIEVSDELPEFTPVRFRLTLDSESPHAGHYEFEAIATSYRYEESVHAFALDADPAWEVSGTALWAFGVPQGQGGDDEGHRDPFMGYSGVNVIGTNLEGDYPARANGTITSQPIDCSQIVGTELRLYKWLNVEQPRYDQATVWVGTGGAFTQVWQNPREFTDFTWDELTLDISAVADGHPDVQVRFGLSADGGDQYSGWNIDDIRIGGMIPGTPLPTPSPVPPSPTMTPAPGDTGVSIGLNRELFRAGDPFELTLTTWNTSQEEGSLALFLILDVEGAYWFWPDWSSEPGWEMRVLSAGMAPVQETILSFNWPDDAGAARGIRFWAGFSRETLDGIVGTYDRVEWGFE